MGLIFSETGKAFRQAIRLRPEDFEIEGEYLLRDKKTNFVWWIRNGEWFFDFGGPQYSILPTQKANGVKFGLIERHWLWQEYVWWKRKYGKKEKDMDREVAVKLAMGFSLQETKDGK